MTITRQQWPAWVPDKYQLQLMVRCAYDADHNWKPPERFAYSYDKKWDLIDFKNKLSRMQNHGSELFDSISPAAQRQYYLEGMIDAFNYALFSSESATIRLSDPIDPKDWTPIKEAIRKLKKDVYGVLGKPRMVPPFRGDLDQSPDRPK